MAAFLGFCVQSLDVVKGAHSTLPYRGFVENVSPQEQWDNIPVIGKLQILVFVGMLESYGEIPGEVPHYTQPGGIPGYYPPLVGKRPELLFNLYDPFDFFVDDDEESKERGLNVELNNGRAAQLAIMAMLTASKGLIVPPLDAIPGFPKYSGDVMVPFEGQLHVAMPELSAWTEQVRVEGRVVWLFVVVCPRTADLTPFPFLSSPLCAGAGPVDGASSRSHQQPRRHASGKWVAGSLWSNKELQSPPVAGFDDTPLMSDKADAGPLGRRGLLPC